MLGAFDISNLP